MSFSQKLAELVRSSRHSTDDLTPAGCGCETGHSELGAWVFCCRPCLEAGMRAMMSAPTIEQLQLEMDGIVKSAAPPEAGA